MDSCGNLFYAGKLRALVNDLLHAAASIGATPLS